jgi:hypothetical protein
MTPIDTFVLCLVTFLSTSLATVIVATRRRQRLDVAELERRATSYARLAMLKHPSYDVERGKAADFAHWEHELEDAEQ